MNEKMREIDGLSAKAYVTTDNKIACTEGCRP